MSNVSDFLSEYKTLCVKHGLFLDDGEFSISSRGPYVCELQETSEFDDVDMAMRNFTTDEFMEKEIRRLAVDANDIKGLKI